MINSVEEFIKLRDSREKSEYDRSAMEEAPMLVWLEIIEKHPEYGRWVAHNKTVPLEILEILSTMDDMTKQFVAGKRKLNAELFSKLSSDPSSTVRVVIAGNRKAPTHILEKLLMDVDEDVARIAGRNLQKRRLPGARKV